MQSVKIVYKEKLSELSKEELVGFCCMASRIFWTQQNTWTLNVNQRYGTAATVELLEKVMTRVAQVQAHRYKKFFGLGDDIPSYVKAMTYSQLFCNWPCEWIEISDRTATMRNNDCPMQRARVRMGLGEIPCKAPGTSAVDEFAKVINRRMKAICTIAPPDRHSWDKWCEFRVELEDRMGQQLKPVTMETGRIDYKQNLSQLSKEQLVEFGDIIARNFWSLQNTWMVNINQTYGIAAATDLDRMVFIRSAQVQAHLYKRLFDLGNDIASYVKAMTYSQVFSNCAFEWVEITDSFATIRITDCPMQRARIELGLGELPCKFTGNYTADAFAKVINPNMMATCIIAPPDKHPDDRWCEFRVDLEPPERK